MEDELRHEIEADDPMPPVRHQEREFVGMLEYRAEDEPLLLRNLIIGWISTSHMLLCCTCRIFFMILIFF